MTAIHERKDGVSLSVQVLPRSSRCALAGIQDGALRLKLTAAPVDGKANEECIAFLAGLLGVKRGQLEILSGYAARKKVIAIRGVTRETVESRLSLLLPGEFPGNASHKKGSSGLKASWPNAERMKR